MAPHSSTLAWKIPWMEKPGRLQSMGLLGVRHNWVTSLSLFTFMHWRRKWQPTPVFLAGGSQGRGSLLGCRLWVAQSRTRLKRLSSSSTMKPEPGAKKVGDCWFVGFRKQVDIDGTKGCIMISKYGSCVNGTVKTKYNRFWKGRRARICSAGRISLRRRDWGRKEEGRIGQWMGGEWGKITLHSHFLPKSYSVGIFQECVLGSL